MAQAKRTKKQSSAGKARRKSAEATKKKARRRPVRRAAKAAALRRLVPEPVESIEVIKKALDRIEGTRGARELVDALERLSRVLEDVNERAQDLERRTREGAGARVEGFRARLRALPAIETVREWPERATQELDALLERVGLMRVSRHADAVEAAKRRAKRAAERKARAAAKRAPRATAAAGGEAAPA